MKLHQLRPAPDRRVLPGFRRFARGLAAWIPAVGIYSSPAAPTGAAAGRAGNKPPGQLPQAQEQLGEAATLASHRTGALPLLPPNEVTEEPMKAETGALVITAGRAGPWAGQLDVVVDCDQKSLGRSRDQLDPMDHKKSQPDAKVAAPIEDPDRKWHPPQP